MQFPYSYGDRPRWMNAKQWHYMRKHRPQQLVKLIEESRAGHQPLALAEQENNR